MKGPRDFKYAFKAQMNTQMNAQTPNVGLMQIGLLKGSKLQKKFQTNSAHVTRTQEIFTFLYKFHNLYKQT